MMMVRFFEAKAAVVWIVAQSSCGRWKVLGSGNILQNESEWVNCCTNVRVIRCRWISWLTFWFFPNEIFLPVGAFLPGFVAILSVLRWILDVTKIERSDEEEKESQSHMCHVDKEIVLLLILIPRLRFLWTTILCVSRTSDKTRNKFV